MTDSNDNFLTRPADIKAKLKYRTTEEGGRKRSAYSGYRPHVKFPGKFELTSGQQRFVNTNEVKPGETVEAEITLLFTDPFRNYLYVGLNFNFYESSVLIGSGVILEVLNKSLEKKI